MRGWMGVFLVLNLTLWLLVTGISTYQIVTRTWEYRAVYHMDCASYMTET